MFVCQVCGTLESSLNKLKTHLHRHLHIGELQLPLHCQDCKNSYANVYNYIRHIRTYHSTNRPVSAAACMTDVTVGNEGDDCDDVVIDDDCDEASDISDTVAAIQTEGVSMVAALRASNIPYNIIPNIVESFNSVSASVSSVVRSQTLDTLLSAGVSSDLVESIKLHLDSRLENIRKPLAFLSTRYKQDRYFDNHALAVKPESITLGTEILSRSGTSTLSYECFQYVSVEKTLRALLQSKDYVSLLLSDRFDSDILQNYVDGEQPKIHPLFGDKNKLSIMIQLFYDGLGVTNPLRGQSVLHNIGVFFTL